MSSSELPRTAARIALGLSLAAMAACVDIVGVENLSAAPAAPVDAGTGGAAGKDGGDSGYSGASGTITVDAPLDAVQEVATDGSGDADAADDVDALQEAAADASACPPARPLQGTDCTGALECVYDACAEATLDFALAVCQSGKWALFAQPCALYPCGAVQCLFPRLLCVSVQGGAGSCANNPCITTLSFGATCSCAKDLCQVAPSYQCNPAATSSYVVSCIP